MLTHPTTGLGVCGVQWNPAAPEVLAVVLSSGGLYVLEVKEDVMVVTTEPRMGATCCEWPLCLSLSLSLTHALIFLVCWSPKGKQLALGLRDGSIVQYSPKVHTHSLSEAWE